jgi:formylglycine-generating enzyme required for sulfatase activity
MRKISPLLLTILFVSLSCSFKGNSGPGGSARNDQKFKEIDGMIYIPGGTFKMGSNKKRNEYPIHTVTISSFYLDRHEVTVEEYKRFCTATRRKMPEQPEWNEAGHPVVKVTWIDARDYAKWAGKRLPTEAEWEYAARGTAKSFYYTYGESKHRGKNYGDIADETFHQIRAQFPVVEKYYDGFVYTAPVETFPRNIFGLYDMEGNVLEWCADWYDPKYYRKSPKKDPKGPETGKYKVIRGASWNRGFRYLRATYRTYYPVKADYDFLGFRCARDTSYYEDKSIARQ